MKYITLLAILFPVCLAAEKEYFQQHVAYDIEVTLDDSAHTLDAYEKIIYTNNSPDTLSFIWFHLWPMHTKIQKRLLPNSENGS